MNIEELKINIIKFLDNLIMIYKKKNNNNKVMNYIKLMNIKKNLIHLKIFKNKKDIMIKNIKNLFGINYI